MVLLCEKADGPGSCVEGRMFVGRSSGEGAGGAGRQGSISFGMHYRFGCRRVAIMGAQAANDLYGLLVADVVLVSVYS